MFPHMVPVIIGPGGCIQTGWSDKNTEMSMNMQLEFSRKDSIFASWKMPWKISPHAMRNVYHMKRTPGHPDVPSPSLSPLRRGVFAALTFSLPVILLLLLEIILRVCHYGGDLALVIRKEVRGKEMLTINQRVAGRYFTSPGLTVPEPAGETFDVRKSPGTKRIFFLGESTMAGFPYEHTATAPSFLGQMLREILPGHRYEIINVGLSAVGSAVVDDFMDELMAYEPDLFVVYVGHNEFYGVYGMGSSISPGVPQWMTRLALRLLRWKTYVLARDIELAISRLVARPAPAEATLMGQVVREEIIPLNSEMYRQGRERYRQNLRSIASRGRAAGVPVLFSALVCNLADMPPFRSSLPDGMPAEAKSAWLASVKRADSVLSAGHPAEALALFEHAEREAPGAAQAAFGSGRAMLALGRDEDARLRLARARDEDPLRFRATGEFADTLRAVAREYGAPVAGVDTAFAHASPHGVPGAPLFLEHLHPTIRGYLLMARTWSEALQESNLLAPSGEWHRERFPADSVVLERAGVTDFDRVVGEIKIAALVSRWPFMPRDTPSRFRPTSPVDSVVDGLLRRGLPWSEARYRLSEFYAMRGEYNLARRECNAVAHALPSSPDPLLRVADLFRREGRIDEAFAAYRGSIEREETAQARMSMAVVLLEANRPSEAAADMQRAFDVARTRGVALPPEVAAAGHFLLANARLQTGHPADARKELEAALSLRPAYPEARQLLDALGRR